MQEEIARVVSYQNGIAEVSTKIQNTCDHCEQSSHCGTGLLARYLAPKPENLKLHTQLPLQPGQQVKIGLPESLLLKLAFAIYVMPILILVLSATLLTAMFPGLSEILLVLLCAITCVGWFAFLRLAISTRRFELTEPEIIQVYEADETPVKFIATP